MNWLEDAKRIYEEQRQIQEASAMEKETSLFIESESDIPNDISWCKSIVISSKYDSRPIDEVLLDLVDRARNIEKLRISEHDVTWDLICSLNLRNIEELSFSLDGCATGNKLSAPKLKKLSIFGNDDLTPMELMIRPYPHFDFSGLKSLERLEIKHLQQVDPADFQELSTLKRLVISDSDIYDLRWLEQANYQLESLYINGPLEDCTGIQNQHMIRHLSLTNSNLHDVSPIEGLYGLKSLDLRFLENIDDSGLRSMGIKSLIVKRHDMDMARIRDQISWIERNAVMHYRADESRINNGVKMSDIHRHILSRRLEKPFEDGIKIYIQMEFDRRLENISKNMCFVFTMTDEEYKNEFINEAKEYCPFLLVKQNDTNLKREH